MTSPFASMAIRARARISLPLGWSGQGTVSSSTSPLASAGFHGVFLPPGKGPDRSLHFLGDWSRSRAKLHLVEGDYFGRIELLLCGFDLQACTAFAAWRTVWAIICVWGLVQHYSLDCYFFQGFPSESGFWGFFYWSNLLNTASISNLSCTWVLQGPGLETIPMVSIHV